MHVRTIKGQSGLIAASSGCQSVAKEAADWLGFVLAPLPEKSRSPGSLERYISAVDALDMITFAIPDSTPRSELWSRYGDALMNLLLSDRHCQPRNRSSAAEAVVSRSPRESARQVTLHHRAQDRAPNAD